MELFFKNHSNTISFFTALFTLLAIIFSYYVFLTQNKTKLKASISVFNGWGYFKDQSFLVLVVKNYGITSIFVNGYFCYPNVCDKIYFYLNKITFGKISKYYSLINEEKHPQIIDKSIRNKEYPIEILPKQSEQFLIMSLQDFKNILKDKGKNDKLFFKFEANLEAFNVELSKDLEGLIIK